MVFTVNSQQWKIVYCNPNSNNLRRSDGSITLAVTDNNTKCIYMNNRLNGYMFEKVLCHELTHVICFSWDIFLPIETEEWLANFMAEHGKEIIYLLDDLLSIAKLRAM